MYITKETKLQLSGRCYDNSYAAGPVLITTKIPRFHLTQGSSTSNNLMEGVNSMRELCLLRGRPPIIFKEVANGDIWFFTERDWNQGCCHDNNIVGIILFPLWCTFLVPGLKITAPIFLEIFLIQYFIVLMELLFYAALIYISRDILDWLLNCFSGTIYDIITFLICIIQKRQYL